jgi:hypothetical protein
MSYAMGYGLRFAGSGSGDDEKRAFGVEGGFSLPLVKTVEVFHRPTIP